jgi:hypothetical protein
LARRSNMTGKTKGSHVKSFFLYLNKTFSEAERQRLLAQLTPEERLIAEGKIPVRLWIDHGVWWNLLVKTDRILGDGSLKLIRDIAVFDADTTLKGIYRMFVSMLHPEFLVSQSDLLWRLYYDTGHLKVVKLDKHFAEVHLVDYPDLPLHHDVELSAWVAESCRLSGGKNIRMTHPQCVATGASHCILTMSWE